MNQLKRKTSKVVTKLVSTMTMFALLVTSIAVSPAVSADAAKVTVKSVSVTKPATKILVLKKGQSFALKTSVSVKPNKASNKKVTFKSSKSSVVSVSAKGKVVAKGNGSAVITVTSKANTKKVAKITVKVGTPITKVSLNSKSKSLNVGATYTLKATISPKKPTVKSVVWSSSNKKVATVTSKGKVTAKGAGTATITALAGDGSGKLAKCKVTVAGASTPTPTVKPTATPDTRARVLVQNFESIPEGPIATDDASALNFTFGNRDISKIPGAAMEIVKDPANPNNKVLRISISTDYATKYSGYDYGPVLRVDLDQTEGAGTTLDNYEAIKFMTRVVSDSDHTYKAAVAYFAPYKELNYKYAFSTYDEVQAGDDLETASQKQFNIKYPMARSKTLGLDADSKYIDDPTDLANKEMPQIQDGVTMDEGYSLNDHTVPMASRTLQFIKANLFFKDKMGQSVDLKKLSKFDVVLGSTYPESNVGERTVWYVDDVYLLKASGEKIPATALALDNKTLNKYVADKAQLIPTLTPANSTDLVEWSSSDTSVATVDNMGKISCIAIGTATITATVVGNPNLKDTCTLTITAAPAMPPIVAPISTSTLKGDSAAYNTRTVNADGSVTITYSAKDQSVVFDLGEAKDLTKYKQVQIDANPAGQLTFEMYADGQSFTGDYYKEFKFEAYPFHDADGTRKTATIELTGSSLSNIRYFNIKTGHNAEVYTKATPVTIYSVTFIPKTAA